MKMREPTNKQWSSSKMRNNILLLTCCFIIGIISVYDTYLTLIYPYDVYMNEQNPLAEFIIHNNGIANFITIKAFTTIITVCLLIMLMKTKYRISIVLVCLFQLYLFYYLNFYGNIEYSHGYDNCDMRPVEHLMQYIEDPQEFIKQNPLGQDLF